ncbi:hypothetical protein GCM10007857_81210 [Bradyrhizobium iriomotense]|uniref:Uncharacterized protein n=1 Tax=Bradyrhizobium iriomotense TaxID=441950 RepID=A0ABQ6BAK4_9BRAD|nr:hypothetical protein GCM10007857_81210 [Bradyrhizobium iriomotense]
MNENRVGSRIRVSVSTRNRFLHWVTGNQRFYPRHENQVFPNCIPDGPQTAREFVDVSYGVSLANERVHFWKTAVLQRQTGRTTLAEFAREETRIVEIAETAITVNEHRQLGRVDYAFDDVDELAP